ncbi:MAG: hypothetical protein HOP02_14575 [Methylococcaceae bacterium]|nr:hypothetical protein [Methylococcaceae bacterium]
MTSEIDGLVAWRNRNGVPVFMGEYGSIKFASTASRGRYARDSTNNLKRTQIPGCTWAFGDGAFQIYDSTTNKWDENIIAGIQLGTKDIVLYDDAMGSWLRNTSWNSVTSNPNTQFKKSGANSLEVNLPASVGWSGYEFSWQRSTIPAAPPLSPYSALRFWIYGTPSTGVLQVSIHQEGNDANGNPIIIPPTRTVNITPTSGAWREVVIPMTDLGSPTNNYFRLTFKGMTESATPHKFYLDDVRLSQTGSATPPGKLLIYDDIYENTSPAGLATWLYDSSWTGVITKPSTQVVKSGASSLEVEFPASVGWAGYELGLQRKHLDVSLMPYSALRFWIYGTSSTGALQVAIDQAIWVNGYIPGGSFNRFITPAFTPTLGWSEVKIPLSSFKPLPDNRTNGNLTQLFRLSFKGATESTVAPKFYLDQVQFE